MTDAMIFLAICAVFGLFIPREAVQLFAIAVLLVLGFAWLSME